MAKTPATRPWSELRTDALNAIGLPDSTKAQARASSAMKAAVNRLNQHRWKSLFSYEDIILATDTATYALDASFRASRRALLLDSNDLVRSRISYQGPELFDEVWGERHLPGSPSHYTILNDSSNYVLELNRPASAAFLLLYPTLRLRGYPAVQYLVNPADSFGTQGVQAEYEQFIETYMRYWLCKDHRPQEARDWEREMEKQWALIKMADNEFDNMDWE